MKLADYILQQGISNAEFARRSGLSEGTISLLCKDESWLKRDTAERIFRATDGAVTPNDFLSSEAAQ